MIKKFSHSCCFSANSFFFFFANLRKGVNCREYRVKKTLQTTIMISNDGIPSHLTLNLTLVHFATILKPWYLTLTLDAIIIVGVLISSLANTQRQYCHETRNKNLRNKTGYSHSGLVGLREQRLEEE